MMNGMKAKSKAKPDASLKLTLQGFAEARSKLIDVAAFLDRCDRHHESGDVRHEAIRQAIAILADGNPERVRRILERLSDPTVEPAVQNPGKSAIGVWPGLKPGG